MRARAGTLPRALWVMGGLLVLGLAAAACGGDEATAQSSQQTAKATVTRIAFIDLQESCKCTRERIDGTWAQLETALQGRSDITVDRIQQDVDPDRAAPYLEMRAMMVAPGLYLLDADGALVEMLQGELTAAQIGELLP